MNITKLVLKRPVTTVLAILCLFVFGLSSVLNSTMELTPEMNIPMMVISTVYGGASPDDISELITKPIEDEVGTLSGIKNTVSMSQENVSIVMLEYEYGTDMDKAYDDLKKKMDNIGSDLPEDAQAPGIFEFNMNDMPSVTLAIQDPTVDNLYNYVENEISPEFEKISSVASVDISGGREGYVSIQLIPEKMAQYRLNMSSIASAVENADFTFPAGSTEVGGQELSVSTAVEFNTLESLKKIPVVAGGGKTVYLEDVAYIFSAEEEAQGIGRYNGEDIVSVSIKKQQKSSAMDVSKSVTRAIETLKAEHPQLEVVVVSDTSDQIEGALGSVVNTLWIAVLISMAIIFLFFGDFKASLIVGSSIPVSILAALILMSAMGFSLNVITMSSLVLGVGMMVDNSIVVLESCFRSTKGNGFREYLTAAIEGSGTVLQSIIGGTVTTCVVFLPLALLEGMTGQMFKPLGFTIVFCMLASLISAMTVVPLCYSRFRPIEKQKAPMSRAMEKLQNGYRKVMRSLLKKRKTVMFTSIAVFAFSLFISTMIGFELMPETDEGIVSIAIETRPGLKTDKVDEILKKAEAIVTQDPDLDYYMLTYGGGGMSLSSDATLTAYLKDDRKQETAEVIQNWKEEMNQLDDCNVTLESSSSSSMGGGSAGDLEVILQGAQFDEVKDASDRIMEDLKARPELIKVHSDMENAAPVVKVRVDPVKAAAEGLPPIQIGNSINSMLSGLDATTLEVNGEDIDVTVEYDRSRYETIDQVRGIILPTQTGSSVALADIADIVFEDSPSSITRKNKQYQVTISGIFTEAAGNTEEAKEETLKKIDAESVTPHLTETVARAKNSQDESMAEEFGALLGAIATAVFLVFVVMAAQFESPKFSMMVMTTIPFSLIGSFGLLFIANVKISMPSLLGFLMLIGTVVNSGILYVDTTNQYRAEMDMETALVEAGATRLRPILMTTLTTIVAMVPMCFAYGDSGETMQGLALVNVGGLTASTVLSMLMLPVYYSVMNRSRKKALPELD